ncbi:Gfo/Idh/MocA family oxidoreductase, partial [Mycobacterium tuberculosis]|nr:Gfo/Idh/MocA family oxidoreductase [Mycobacterium tuberculosis]
LVHLGEANAELASQRAAEFGFAKASGDWRAVINDPDVDVVSITTPNQFHPEMALAALQAGKHVWCEKPMAPAFDDAKAMT